MKISVTAAKAQLTELVRRAEEGDEVILTRHGHAAVRLVPMSPSPDPKARLALLREVQRSGGMKASQGPSGASSQDYLYDDDGLPL